MVMNVDGIAGAERFYREHAQELMRLSTMLVGPDNAEDVLSEALISVFQSSAWPNLGEDEKLPYTQRAVVNKGRSWFRSSSRRTKREELYGRGTDPTTGQPNTEHGVPSDILQIVSELSVRQRAVVFLTYWSDYDTATVARTLDISEGSVYQHLNRARRALKERVDV